VRRETRAEPRCGSVPSIPAREVNEVLDVECDSTTIRAPGGWVRALAVRGAAR
jgi:hypothetical protein